MAYRAVRPLLSLPVPSRRARRSDGLPASQLSLRRPDTLELAGRSLRTRSGDRDVRSARQVEHSHLSVAQIRSSRGAGRAVAERDVAARQRIVPRLRGADDGGCPVLGAGGTICHRIHPDGRRTAWRDPRLDEIYLPGAGWRGFDPTNNKLVGSEHISVAVAREQEKASPLSGSWEGPADAFSQMKVSVQVVPAPRDRVEQD